MLTLTGQSTQIDVGAAAGLPGTPLNTQNTACLPLTLCPCTEYDSDHATRSRYAQRTCTPLTTCGDDEYEVRRQQQPAFPQRRSPTRTFSHVSGTRCLPRNF